VLLKHYKELSVCGNGKLVSSVLRASCLEDSVTKEKLEAGNEWLLMKRKEAEERLGWEQRYD
jgi:hypothetical protein